MNKKGGMTLIIVVLSVMAALAILLIASPKHQVQSSYIGEIQLAVLDTVQKSENILLYFDVAAKFAFEESLIELYQQSDCGKIDGFNKLNNCFPNNIKQKMSILVSKKFNQYLKNYPIASPPNYHIDFVYDSENQLNMIAIAQDDLRFPLGKPLNLMKYLSEIDKEYIKNDIPVQIDFIPSNNAIDRFLKSENSPLVGIGGCLLDVQKETKVPWDVALTQAIHESGWGRSQLATKQSKFDETFAYNLFGYKCTSKKEGTNGCSLRETHECYSSSQQEKNKDFIIDCNQKKYKCSFGKDDCLVKAKFRAYNNYCESIYDYATLISSFKRYSGAMNYLDSSERMFIEIHKGGYATDSEYSNKLIKLHRRIMTSFQGNKITGEATIELDKKTTQREISGVYEVKPNVKIKVFDFIKYLDNIKKRSIIILDECGKAKNKLNCVKKNALYWDCKGKYENKGNVYKFCSTDLLSNEYKFALELSNLQKVGFKVEDKINAENSLEVTFDYDDLDYYLHYTKNLDIEPTIVKLEKSKFELEVEDNIDYYVKVISENSNNDYVKVKSIDDLSPEKPLITYIYGGLTVISPTRNVDSSSIKETELKVNLYYGECDSMFDKKPLILGNMATSESKNFNVPEADCYGVYLQGNEEKPSNIEEYSRILDTKV